MSVFVADIKNTFSSAITELKADLLALTEKMVIAERTGHRKDRAISRLESMSEILTSQLIAVNRHLEDLDYRGRRHNLRVRGIPETVNTDQITSALTSIFNNLLERPVDTLIEFEHAHRALRPRPIEAAPPRDIICCLTIYKLKEEILAQAHQNEHISFNDHNITLFQDLSLITLGNRRALHPVLEILKEKSLSYRWKFPFALSVTHNGKQLYLKTPEDLTLFWTGTENFVSKRCHTALHTHLNQHQPKTHQSKGNSRGNRAQASVTLHNCPKAPEPGNQHEDLQGSSYSILGLLELF